MATCRHFYERETDLGLQFIEECGAESITKERIVKIIDVTLEAVITIPAFGNKAVNVEIPF